MELPLLMHLKLPHLMLVLLPDSLFLRLICHCGAPANPYCSTHFISDSAHMI